MPQDSLSALLDGECSEAELDRLLDELERSPELGRQWSRLCLARESRAGTRVTVDQPCICEDVMTRLDAVPAPVRTPVVDLSRRWLPRRARWAGRWKPAAGFAAAASLGAAAIMLIQPQAGPQAGGGSALVAGGANAGWSGAAPPLRTVSAEDSAHAQMLREYLMDHSSAVADEGVGGTMRYARFAAHTAEYRPDPDSLP